MSISISSGRLYTYIAACMIRLGGASGARVVRQAIGLGLKVERAWMKIKQVYKVFMILSCFFCSSSLHIHLNLVDAQSSLLKDIGSLSTYKHIN